MNAEQADTSELPVDSDRAVEVTEAGEDNCHLDMQLDKLNLTNADTAGRVIFCSVLF